MPAPPMARRTGKSTKEICAAGRPKRAAVQKKEEEKKEEKAKKSEEKEKREKDKEAKPAPAKKRTNAKRFSPRKRQTKTKKSEPKKKAENAKKSKDVIEKIEEDSEEEVEEEAEEKHEEKKKNEEESDAEESSPDDGEQDDSDESEFDPENDPEKLWCFCNRPHGNRFMICCDTCEDWFHGSCVGITMDKGREMEKTGEEWSCDKCKGEKQKAVVAPSPLNTPLNTSEPAPPSPVPVKKAPLVGTVSLDKLKSNLAKSLKSAVPRTQDEKKEPAKTPTAKTPTPEEKQNLESKTKGPTQINELDNENKEEKSKAGDSSEKSEQNKTIDTEDGSTTAEDSSPTKKFPRREKGKTDLVKDTLNKIRSRRRSSKETGTDIITFEQVPVKSQPQQQERKRERPFITDRSDDESDEYEETTTTARKRHDKPKKTRTTPTPTKEALVQCVREDCSRSVVKNSIYCSRECIYKYANESMKFLDDERRKSTFMGSSTTTTSTGTTVVTAPATSSTDRVTTETNQERIAVFEKSSGKVVAGVMAPTKKYLFAWLEEHPTYEILKPGKQPSMLKNTKKEQDELVRNNVRQALLQAIKARCKQDTDISVNVDSISKACKKIEGEMLKMFGETKQKYKSKYRSLIFNLKDEQNKILYKRVVSGEITPRQLVHMSPEQLAAPELAQWRKEESKHHLDMVKKREEESAELNKTPRLKQTHKGEVEIVGDKEDLGTLESKIDTGEEISSKASLQPAPEPSVMALLNDTTAEHANHLFDASCKICTGKIAPPGESQITGVSTTVVQAESSMPSPDDIDMTITRISRPSSSLSTTPPSPDTSMITPISPISPASPSATVVTAVKPKQSSVWRGFVTMQKVSKFVTTAYKVAGSCEGLMQILPDTIQVCGRIPPTQVWDYLTQLKNGRKHKCIDVIRFEMSSKAEKAGYIKLYTYFYTRQRIGVIGNCYDGVKDMYILPLASHDPVPSELKPLPGLPMPRPHMLLGIIVRIKPTLPKVLAAAKAEEENSAEVKKKKKKLKKKELEAQLETQKKLVDIIFQNRTILPPVDPAVDALTLIKNALDSKPEAITPEKQQPADVTTPTTFMPTTIPLYKPSFPTDHPPVKLISPNAVVSENQSQPAFEFLSPEKTEEQKRLEAEQLQKIREQEEEIARLQKEVGELSTAITSTQSDTPVMADEKRESMVLENISDDESNDKQKPPKTTTPSTPDRRVSLDSLVNLAVRKEVPPEEQIPLLGDPSTSTEKPEDDTMDIINSIKITESMPKFPLDFFKARSREKKMPELPAISLPLAGDPLGGLPLPGHPPPVPLPPGMKLPPGIPLPPLPPPVPKINLPPSRDDPRTHHEFDEERERRGRPNEFPLQRGRLPSDPRESRPLQEDDRRNHHIPPNDNFRHPDSRFHPERPPNPHHGSHFEPSPEKMQRDNNWRPPHPDHRPQNRDGQWDHPPQNNNFHLPPPNEHFNKPHEGGRPPGFNDGPLRPPFRPPQDNNRPPFRPPFQMEQRPPMSGLKNFDARFQRPPVGGHERDGGFRPRGQFERPFFQPNKEPPQPNFLQPPGPPPRPPGLNNPTRPPIQPLMGAPPSRGPRNFAPCHESVPCGPPRTPRPPHFEQQIFEHNHGAPLQRPPMNRPPMMTDHQPRFERPSFQSPSPLRPPVMENPHIQNISPPHDRKTFPNEPFEEPRHPHFRGNDRYPVKNHRIRDNRPDDWRDDDRHDDGRQGRRERRPYLSRDCSPGLESRNRSRSRDRSRDSPNRSRKRSRDLPNRTRDGSRDRFGRNISERKHSPARRCTLPPPSGGNNPSIVDISPERPPPDPSASADIEEGELVEKDEAWNENTANSDNSNLSWRKCSV